MVTTLNIDFQMLKGSLLRSRWFGVADIQTNQSFNGCPCYLQNEKDLL